MKNDYIILDEEKGVNSRMTVCERCGKNLGVILPGKDDYVGHCSECNSYTIGVSERGDRCAKCNSRLDVERRKLGDYEKIPCGLCDKCEKELKDSHDAVKKLIDAGGIHFKCLECGGIGALAKSEATEAIRADALEAGLIENYNDEFGIEFGKCTEHGAS